MRKVYSQQLAKFQLFNNLDELRFGRDDLKRFFAEFYKHLHVTELTAIEGIHFARGSLMEKSATFNREKLLDWLAMQIPILEHSAQIQLNISAASENVENKARFRTYAETETDLVLSTVDQNPKAKKKLLDSLIQLE